MDDLISRAALLKECAERQKTDPRFEGRGWTSHFINDAGEPSAEWYCVEDMIENAPTIDAIPVEWLRERKHWAAIDGDHWAENIISYLLEAWQKEQEADIAQKLGIEPKEG